MTTNTTNPHRVNLILRPEDKVRLERCVAVAHNRLGITTQNGVLRHALALLAVELGVALEEENNNAN